MGLNMRGGYAAARSEEPAVYRGAVYRRSGDRERAAHAGCGLALLFLLLVLAAGCWDRREVEERGYVLSMAFDRPAAGDRQKPGADEAVIPAGDQPDLALTVEIAIPGELIGGQTIGGGGGGGGGGGSTGEKPAWVLTSTGENPFSIVRIMATRVNRTLFFSHTQAVVLGEKLAREGIREVWDFLSRNNEFSRRFLVAVARGEGRKVINIRPRSERVVGPYLRSLSTQRFKTSRFPPGDFNQLDAALRSSGGTALLPRVVAGTDEVKLAGAAIFKDFRLIGWLGEEETQGVMMVRNQVKGGEVEVTCPGGEGRVVYEIANSSSRLRPWREGNRFSILVELRSEGQISLFSCREDLGSPAALRALEEKVARRLEALARAAVNRLQGEFNADVVGFGDLLKKRWPRDLKDVNWEEEFPRLPVEVRAEVKIRRIGTSTLDRW